MLRQEVEVLRARCERVEREKSDILLRRLAAMETTPSKTTASEVSTSSELDIPQIKDPLK